MGLKGEVTVEGLVSSAMNSWSDDAVQSDCHLTLGETWNARAS